MLLLVEYSLVHGYMYRIYWRRDVVHKLPSRCKIWICSIQSASSLMCSLNRHRTTVASIFSYVHFILVKYTDRYCNHWRLAYLDKTTMFWIILIYAVIKEIPKQKQNCLDLYQIIFCLFNAGFSICPVEQNLWCSTLCNENRFSFAD